MAASSPAQAADLAFAQISVGDVFEIAHTFEHHDVLQFAGVSGDFSPLHVDPVYASRTEFGRCVVHGMLLASLFSRLVGMHIPGKPALYLGQDLSFRKPVLVGETVRAIAKVVSKVEATQTLQLATEIRNSEDKVVVSGTAKVKVRSTGMPEHAASQAAAVRNAVQVAPAAARAVIVTGASRGIGAAIAHELGRRGMPVVVNYFRGAAAAEQVAERINTAGGKALPVRCDVRNRGDVEQMLAAATSQLGAVTALVNCAAGDLPEHEVATASWSEFEEQLEYQVKAVLQACQAAYPVMKQAGGGSIVNLLSQVVDQPPPRMAAYVTAKFALEGLSKAMAAEWAAANIRVNMVSPGLVQTAMTQHYPERLFKLEASRTPLRRIAQPEDVACAVAFLLSDEASFLTGVNLSVTGGQVMK